MKKKHVTLWICGMALMSSLWFMGCPTTTDPEDPQETTYRVITEAELAEGGTFTVSPQSGPSGTKVTVTVTSAEQYSLDEVFVDGVSRGKTNPVTVTLVDKDVTVKAVFKDLPLNSFKVTLKQPDEGGTISILTIGGVSGMEYGSNGATVTLSNNPAEGYVFKEYTATDADGAAVAINTNTFTLPAKHVTVSGVFEKLADKDINELITAGKDALKAGNTSVTINAYEAAYAKDKNNAEALVYSTLGKLASIAWSKEVGDFFKNHLGLTYYPDTLDALINPESWFTYYPDGDGTGGKPPLNVPEWVKEKTPYTNSLVAIDGKDVASSATWSIVLIANLIDKNTTGLNGALDDVINAVFNNPNYKEAETRAAKLKSETTSIKLDGDIVQLLGLSQFFGDGDEVYVGWAELELLLSALKLIKATLLYVDSYNWTYDIGFVKDLPWDESVLDQIDTIAGNRNKVLPLRTGFMTARGGSYLEDSRKAYVEALTSIIAVYDYYTGDQSKLPKGFKDVLKEYQSYKEEVVKAKDAIDKKETFTVTVDGQTLTVNFGKFFTSGQLALEKLIETEGSGDTKSPVFYGFNEGSSKSVKISTLDDFEKEEYQSFGFNVKTEAIEEIIGGEFADSLLESGVSLPVLDPMTAQIAWAVYHWDEGGEDFITELFGAESKSVAKLR